MTSNLKYTLTANSTAIGVNHNTNETFTFNTGSVCGGGNTNADCIMNGNTVMTEQVTNGGYYYSWYAATAGTGTASMASGDATGSICPKGWRLPANYTSDPDKSYGSITQAYLGLHESIWEDFTTTLESIPLQFLRAGCYNFGLLSGVGLFNVTWSSSVKDSPNAYDFNYEDRFIAPQAYHTKYQGFSVRCVAQ